MKRVFRRILTCVLSLSIIAGSFNVPVRAAEGQQVYTDRILYGHSVRGRELVCYSIAPAEYDKTILLTFEIHGFEDSYDHDGQVLVDLANELIAHYETVDDLNRTRLLIVPSVNPDGLLDGYTADGFGRCNANGVDLNRNFDADYTPNTDARNFTSTVFSEPESQGLRNLYLEYKPDIVIDVHGWQNSLVGAVELKSLFKEELWDDITIMRTFENPEASSDGFWAYWAQTQGALSMLLELAHTTGIDVQALENAIDRLIADDFDNSSITYTATDYYTGEYMQRKTRAFVPKMQEVSASRLLAQFK